MLIFKMKMITNELSKAIRLCISVMITGLAKNIRFLTKKKTKKNEFLELSYNSREVADRCTKAENIEKH